MLKRRNKDDGFTLVELMIVIAVIGILAVVLVPRLGGVKDSAKEAGVITNAKSVEAYVIANFDRWVSNNQTEVVGTITSHFTDVKNPITNSSPGVGNTEGKGNVHVHVSNAGKTDMEITISAYGSEETIIYKSKIDSNGLRIEETSTEPTE